MNTAFLSMIPAAPAQEQPVPARPAKSGKPLIEAEESMETAPVDESEPVGDSDKADAFAEMLAALISVATPAVETHVETVQPAAVESVTSTATEIPRDGAGSPLFAASFTTSAPVTPTVAATTTSNPDTILPVNKVGGEADRPQNAVAKPDAGVELSDAAVAELSALHTETAEVTPEAASSTFEVEVPTDFVEETTTVDVADHTGDNELPIVEARETTVDPGAVQQNTVEIPESVGAVDHSVKTRSANTQSRTTEDNAAPVTNPQAAAPKPEASVKQPVATPNEPAASEAPQTESRPVTTPDTAPQDFTPVDEPYEDPIDPRAELENNTSAKSTASRKSPTSAPRSATSAAPVSAEPEVVNAVAPVESSAEVGVRKDVVRERAAAPVAAAEKPAAVALDAEAVLPTGTTNENTAASSSSNVANTHSDSAAASTPSHVSQQVLQALAAYEAELPQGGSRSFEMLLDPPELGRILVQMSRTSKGVDVRISAENETVRSILETTGAEMQQSLQLSGFDLGQFTGSSSGGFANGEEWVAAPTLQSFAADGSVQNRSNTTHTTRTSAVNVIV